MRTAKITLALLIGVVALAGPVTSAQAAGRGPAGTSAPVVSSSADFWCSGNECTCIGDADCNDMYDKFDCVGEWVDTIFGIPIGTCKYPTPRSSESGTPDPDLPLDPRLRPSARPGELLADVDVDDSDTEEAPEATEVGPEATEVEPGSPDGPDEPTPPGTRRPWEVRISPELYANF